MNEHRSLNARYNLTKEQLFTIATRVVLYRGLIAGAFFVGAYLSWASSHVATLVLLAIGTFIFATGSLPGILDLVSGSTVKIEGRVKKYVITQRGPTQYMLRIGDLRFECAQNDWNQIQEEEVYEITSTAWAKWVLGFRQAS